MKEQLISFETAELAKEKGFPQEIAYDHYLSDGKMMTNNYYKDKLLDNKDLIAAPTQSLLQKWLREVHQIDVIIINTQFGQYWFRLDATTKAGQSNKYDTYEQALEKGLQKALKLI